MVVFLHHIYPGGGKMSQMRAVSSAPSRLPLALLADQDADTRRMYALYLERATCAVEEAEDGREALANLLPFGQPKVTGSSVGSTMPRESCSSRNVC